MKITIMDDDGVILEQLNVNEPSNLTVERFAGEVVNVIEDFFDIEQKPIEA